MQYDVLSIRTKKGAWEVEREMARERCNELCTKASTGLCVLCDALDERDRFERFWLKGGLLVDGFHYRTLFKLL